jgi:hypothetical protein
MTMKTTALGLFVAAAFAALSTHAEIGTVEAVQYPAWIERGGSTAPLVPGTRLQPKDKLVTGANARVRVQMGEGSAVKLGENAQFVIETAEDRGLFRATLNVLTGAFRFTTAALNTRKRDISIKAKTVTAGIRGTDLWGKSTGERDLVCLLEGKITVGAEGHPTVTLDQPLDFYQKPRDGAPAVAKVDPKQVEEWAKETEVSAGGAAAKTGGKWRLVAGAKADRDAALALNRRLRRDGYPSEIVQKDNYFVVQVSNLAGEPEARALMSALRNVPGVELPTVHEGK